MKARIRPLTSGEWQREFPVQGSVDDWRFRITETSNGVYLVEGSDQYLRQVSRQGFDPDDLLRQCELEALELKGKSDAAGSSKDGNQT